MYPRVPGAIRSPLWAPGSSSVQLDCVAVLNPAGPQIPGDSERTQGSQSSPLIFGISLPGRTRNELELPTGVWGSQV